MEKHKTKTNDKAFIIIGFIVIGIIFVLYSNTNESYNHILFVEYSHPLQLPMLLLLSFLLLVMPKPIDTYDYRSIHKDYQVVNVWCFFLQLIPND